MSFLFTEKMNLDLTGDSFTDELHNSVGAAAFNLDHDFFINDITSGEVLVIRTAAAGGGTLLVEDTDYTISNQDTLLSDSDHVNKNVYSDITITNAAYQACDLYFSGKYVADSVDSDDANWVNKLVWQYTATSASASITPTGHTVYACTAGVNGIKITLPAVSSSYTNMKLEFIKIDSTNSAVMIDGNGAETINGLTHVFLIEQYQKIQIICTGTAWLITMGVLIADSGYINTNDWTNRHLGTVDVDYDNLNGTFQIGETVTESGGETGIIVKDTGSTLTLWKVTDSGVFTNNNGLTGNISTATADVDEAGTGSTKNLDSNFYHGFGKAFYMLQIFGYNSTDKTEANTFLIHPVVATAGSDNHGTDIQGVDTNNFVWQTGSAAVDKLTIAGARSSLTNEDQYYRMIAKLII